MQAENFTLFTHSVGRNKFRPTVEIQSPRYRLAKFISPTEAVSKVNREFIISHFDPVLAYFLSICPTK